MLMLTAPQRFRKKPVEIEAMRLLAYTQLLGPAEWNDWEGGDVWRWMHNHGVELRAEQVDPCPAYGIIPTLEGDMRADIGDWIIRGVAGEFYPCKPDIFAATYDPIDPLDDIHQIEFRDDGWGAGSGSQGGVKQ